MRRLLPRPRGLPRYSGGSTSIPSLSRPARTLLTLRPAGSLNRPRRPLSRGFGPANYSTKPLVSYQINRQLSGWNLPPLAIRAVGAHSRHVIVVALEGVTSYNSYVNHTPPFKWFIHPPELVHHRWFSRQKSRHAGEEQRLRRRRSGRKQPDRHAASGWSSGFRDGRRCPNRTIFVIRAFPFNVKLSWKCRVHWAGSGRALPRASHAASATHKSTPAVRDGLSASRRDFDLPTSVLSCGIRCPSLSAATWMHPKSFPMTNLLASSVMPRWFPSI